MRTPPPQQSRSSQSQHQPWKRQAQIGQAHNDPVQTAAPIAAQHPQGGSQNDHNAHQGQGGKHTGLQPHQKPGKQVPPVAVGARRVSKAGAFQCRKDLGRGIIGAKKLCKSGQSQQQYRKGSAQKKTAFGGRKGLDRRKKTG